MRNRRTRVPSLSSISAVAIAAGVLLLTGMIDLQTASGQVPGATYTGTTATGAEVEVVVRADGTALNSLRFGPRQGQPGTPGIESPTCGVGQSFESQFGQGLPITNGSFTHTSSTFPPPIRYDIIVNGTFSASQVSGTIAMVFPNDPNCNTGDISWSASTTAAPPPQATPTPAPAAPAGTRTPGPKAPPPQPAAVPVTGGQPPSDDAGLTVLVVGAGLLLAGGLLGGTVLMRRPRG
jgi:hypothetical protein